MTITQYVKPFLAFIMGSIVLILLDILFPLNFIKEKTFSLLLPVTFFSQQISNETKGFTTQLFNVRQIYKENSTLQEQLSVLEGIEALNKELRDENNLFKETLKVSEYNDIPKELAKVIGRERSNSLGFLVINKGKQSGIEHGMPVVIDNRLIGTIDQVFDRNSKVRMINSADSMVAVKIITDATTKSSSFLAGGYGLKMKMTHIDQDALINKGDLVVTSGEGGTLPRNLLVGKVTEVSKKVETMLYQEASIDPIVNFEQLLDVLIYKDTAF